MSSGSVSKSFACSTEEADTESLLPLAVENPLATDLSKLCALSSGSVSKSFACSTEEADTESLLPPAVENPLATDLTGNEMRGWGAAVLQVLEWPNRFIICATAATSSSWETCLDGLGVLNCLIFLRFVEGSRLVAAAGQDVALWFKRVVEGVWNELSVFVGRGPREILLIDVSGSLGLLPTEETCLTLSFWDCSSGWNLCTYVPSICSLLSLLGFSKTAFSSLWTETQMTSLSAGDSAHEVLHRWKCLFARLRVGLKWDIGTAEG